MQTRSKIACADSVAAMLAEYAKRLPPKGSSERSPYYRDLTDFTGCNSDTVGRWVNGANMPLGVPLIKLRFFLAHKGHEPLELIHLRKGYPLGYALAEILTYTSTTVSEASRAIGYTDDYAVLRIAHGDGVADAAHEPGLAAFCDKMRGETRSKRGYWEKRLGAAKAPAESPEPSEPFVCGAPQTLIPVNRNAALETAAYLIFALEPLARLIGQDLGPEDRKEVRGMTNRSDGRSVLFQLITYLNMMSGENAREQILSQKAVTTRKEERS